MPIKTSVAKSGLQAFKSWLNEHFPGRRLDVVYTKDGDEYICSIKFRGVLIGQGRAASQKASAELAAAEAHKGCNGEPKQLRELLRSREGMEPAASATSPETVKEEPSGAETVELKKLRKAQAGQRLLLEQAQNQLLAQARELKRLKREMADLQNLSLAHKLEQLTQELSKLRMALQKRPQSSDLDQRFAQLDETWSQRMVSLEGSFQAALTEKAGKASSRQQQEVAYTTFREAFGSWAPAYQDMIPAVVATLMACKISIIPTLTVARAFQQSLDPMAQLSVWYVEPGWMTPAQACPAGLREQIRLATEDPDRLFILAYDGIQRAGLQTWARAVRQWAQGLASWPETSDHRWPRNLRLCFVPDKQSLILPEGASNLAALPPSPEGHGKSFSPFYWQSFLESDWQDSPEPQATRKRLDAVFKRLAQSHLGDSWTEKILLRWPATYQRDRWWVSTPGVDA